MPTSKVIYKGDLHTDAIHLSSGTIISTDAPVDNHGKGESFSPTDLAATSLANCMMTVMGIGAMGREISIERMEAVVTKVMAQGPRRISEIHVDLTMKISPDNEQNRGILEDIGYNCPVAKSLHPDILQAIKFSYL